jgi:hypothetical protein
MGAASASVSDAVEDDVAAPVAVDAAVTAAAVKSGANPDVPSWVWVVPSAFVCAEAFAG